MNKIVKSLFSTMLVAICIIAGISSVSAKTYNDSFKGAGGGYIDGSFIMMKKGNESHDYNMSIITRNSDGHWAYCIQPATAILRDTPYTGQDTDQHIVSNMSYSQWQRIKLLAYYGYGYSGHTDKKWYEVTQFMIWNTVPNGYDIYFTDTRGGNRISKYTNEIAEMERLISNHNVRPSINGTTTEMVVDDTITLTDTNGVLSNYKVIDSKNVTATISGNNLNVTANALGETSITLEKKDTKYSTAPIVYTRNNSQDIMVVGSYDPIQIKLNIKVKGGKVTVDKVDADTNTNKPQGEATLEGATYDIYTADGTKVGTIITSADGTITSGELPKQGLYYLMETKASNGYQLDETKYYFEITKDNLYPTITVYEKIINRDVEITKVFADEKTGIMKGEPNVMFGFYNNKNELILKAQSDENGYLKVNLPYGKYTVKQLTTTTGYESAEDFIIEIKEIGNTIRYVIANAEVEQPDEEITVEVPNTGLNDSKLLTVVAIIFVIAGSIFIIYDNKKRK